jgi:hypothetical protein
MAAAARRVSPPRLAAKTGKTKINVSAFFMRFSGED